MLDDARLAILNAPFESDGWRRAVEATAAATRSSGAQLLGIGGPLLVPLNVCAGPFAGRDSYFADPALHGRCNWRVGSAGEPLAIQHEEHYAAYRANHQTADYDDAVSDLDIPHGCQSALLLDSNSLLGVALLRSARDGPCDADTLSRFAELRRHFARAVRLQLALDGEASELMLGDMNALNSATLLLDRHGAVSALTPAAEPLFGEDGPLMLDGLVPRLRSRLCDVRFQAALGRVLHAARGAVHALAEVRTAAWRVIVAGLPARDHGLGFDPHVAVTVRAPSSARRAG